MLQRTLWVNAGRATFTAGAPYLNKANDAPRTAQRLPCTVPLA
ncbi:hypothetical protein [Pectobacterium versatile]|nr:hypothetical protein [Pectobacterium versatile]